MFPLHHITFFFTQSSVYTGRGGNAVSRIHQSVEAQNRPCGSIDMVIIHLNELHFGLKLNIYYI